MKLIACHVENFGKLSDFSMNFHDGVNIINEENGWGKSTLAAFLKAMLYGFNNKKAPGEFEKERNKYMPWQGGTYGGELDIEVNGKIYRISRYFGQTEKTDRFRLYDLTTNLESHDFSANIGLELFDLDRESFRRTIFIAQNDCQTGSSDSINAKLGNLAQASDDINNYEKAITAIRSRLNHLSPKRATGTIRRRRDLITQLEQELKGLDAAEEAAAVVREKLAQKQAECFEMIDIRKEYGDALITASEDSRRKALAASYRELEQELEEESRTLKSYVQSFPDQIPSDEEFEECRSLIRRIEAQNVTVHHLSIGEDEYSQSEILRREFADGVPKEELLEEMITRSLLAAVGQKKKMEKAEQINALEQDYVQRSRDSYVGSSAAGSNLVPVGLVVLLFGAVSAVLQWIVKPQGLPAPAGMGILLWIGLVLAAAGAVMAAAGSRSNQKRALAVARQLEERDRTLAELAAPINRAKDELKRLEDKIASDTALVESFLAPFDFVNRQMPLQDQVYEVRSHANSLRAILERETGLYVAVQDRRELNARLQEMARRMGVASDENISAVLNSLQMKIAEYYLIRNTYDKVKERKLRFEEEYDIATILSPQECPFSLEELQELIRKADLKIEALRTEADRYSHQIEDLQQQMDLRDEKEEELAIANEQQKKEAKEYEILELTQHYLQKSKEAFVARYMGPITNAFAKYYEILTGEKSGEWMIDADLCLKLRQRGLMRETHWLSAGYQDLLGVCLRLALVEAMFPGEKPFLVFDDPFVNLDDAKLENGKRLLRGLSREYQSIYFTCHESRQIEELPGTTEPVS